MEAILANLARNKLNSVVVTGGTDGLGRAIAILLSENGYRVFACGRSRQKLAALEKLARERQLSLQAIVLDVCDEVSAERAMSEIERCASAVDVLVNNAGIAIVAAMEEIALEDVRKQFETNVLGAIRMSQLVLPGMRQRRRGRIINMSSLSGKVAHPLYGAYSASKHALEAISDAMRLELHPFGIGVVLIEPGYIATNIKRAAAELSLAYGSGAERSPYRKLYRSLLGSSQDGSSRDAPEDCARLVLRAIRATTPRPRYVMTRHAKAQILGKRLLSDRAMDRWFRKIFALDELRAETDKTAHE
jgi:NAD(P)-dependent dehydrogenase (short-subunit alcohol dehydrogenase family)